MGEQRQGQNGTSNTGDQSNQTQQQDQSQKDDQATRQAQPRQGDKNQGQGDQSSKTGGTQDSNA